MTTRQFDDEFPIFNNLDTDDEFVVEDDEESNYSESESSASETDDETESVESTIIDGKRKADDDLTPNKKHKTDTILDKLGNNKHINDFKHIIKTELMISPITNNSYYAITNYKKVALGKGKKIAKRILNEYRMNNHTLTVMNFKRFIDEGNDTKITEYVTKILNFILSDNSIEIRYCKTFKKYIFVDA